MPATLIFGANSIAPGQLDDSTARCAAGIIALGLGEDDVLALMLHNEPAFIVAMLAARRVGAYHCPINWHFKADEAGHILRDSGATKSTLVIVG